MKAEDFGLTKAEAEKVKDVVPSFDLGQLKYGESARFKILENEPKTVKYKDENDKEQSRQTLRALNLEDGLECTLWLSAKSLKMEFFKLAEKHKGQIKDVTVKITPRQYAHPSYGKAKAYVVQEILANSEE